MTKAITLADIRATVKKLEHASPLFERNGGMFIDVHESLVVHIIAIKARANWKAEWRRQRLARRSIVEIPGVCEVGVIRGLRFPT